jgi:predicted NAD-dependent protein-ADP-ribosyltransferase YbiA (DUF1768 family)
VEIKLDAAQIQGFVEQAIMAQIGEEQRNAVIAQAVTALLTPRESILGYRKTATPLQDAFDNAVRMVAFKAAQDLIENESEARAQILKMVSTPIAEICKGEYDGLADRIGEAVGQAVTEWLRNRT